MSCSAQQHVDVVDKVEECSVWKDADHVGLSWMMLSVEIATTSDQLMNRTVRQLTTAVESGSLAHSVRSVFICIVYIYINNLLPFDAMLARSWESNLCLSVRLSDVKRVTVIKRKNQLPIVSYTNVKPSLVLSASSMLQLCIFTRLHDVEYS